MAAIAPASRPAERAAVDDTLSPGSRERVPALAATAALVLANARYWTRIAPLVRRELRRWYARAAAIPDPAARELAREKLRAEHFNAEVAATLATLAPHAHRARAVEAIVALEVLYDYLDGATERLQEEALERGERLFEPFRRALGARPAARGGGRARDGVRSDGGYAEELAEAVRGSLASLPSWGAVAPAARRAAGRCAAAQVRAHAASRIGAGELERWARADAHEGMPWREHVAGSVASVLSVHALIAAAAAGSSEREAEAIDAAYMSIAALSTMLDSLVDHERDVRCGEPWLASLYGGSAPLGAGLVPMAWLAIARAKALRHGAHHSMTLLGVVAYYTSAPQARGEVARAPVRALHRELGRAISPTLAVMRAWRLAKALRKRRTAARRAKRGGLRR